MSGTSSSTIAPPSDDAYSTLWQASRTLEHEVVQSADYNLCFECAKLNKIEVTTSERYGSHQTELKRSWSMQELSRNIYCWFCRFLCRICAYGLSRDVFVQCFRKHYRIEVEQEIGLLGNKLLLSADSLEGPGFRVAIRDEPRILKSSPQYSEICQFNYDTHITCNAKHSSSSRKLQKMSFNTQGCSVDFGLVRAWLEVFETSHRKACCSEKKSLPSSGDFRVIDIRDGSIVTAGKYCRYIALSYVWGEDYALRDHRSNSLEPGRFQGLQHLPEEIPQTIEDAISVTRALGETFLWIDAYCIEQENPLRRQSSIREMDLIYNGAFLTICVLSAENVEKGIPGVTTPQSGRFQVITDTDLGTYLGTAFSSTNEVIEGSKWATRAWSFQEGALSKRRLCFDDECVFLLCEQEIFHDILHFDASKDRTVGAFDPGGIYYLGFGCDLNTRHWDFDNYARLTASYSRRSLTFPYDAHNAIAGSLRRICRNIAGFTFISALPVQDIHNALLWFHHTVKGYQNDCTRRSAFPSWSWLGWQGPAEHEFWLQPSRSSASGEADRQKDLFSLVDKAELLYHNVVRLRKSAVVNFDSVTTDCDRAVLVLSTDMAQFQVRLIPPTEEEQKVNLRSYQGDNWQILNQAGDPLLRSYSQGFSGDFYVEFPYRRTPTYLFRLGRKLSDRLRHSGQTVLEFVLLQHWTENVVEEVPKILGFVPKEDVPDRNPSFEDRVWVMIIIRKPDGAAERLAVIWLSAEHWFAADPQFGVVRIK